ncbi:nitrilase-related carbon-nitrogen hydrolase [Pseudoxanthomonas winnipegensis]|uniref:nitrilase-related carbon-nitrogen hydrolase n=1 Tax=Pseudoxanthomonas winnipegensis TaxID=2480810 RepID=UPI00103906A4|nr:nitrilase-related carbon-nitrogen hydrolase [Pseudoxanthomonas winnipegensis]TBV73926.1 carbon-nitrogen hydrolase family protein [Pseudoxanthomonas winnipegensis]
MSAPVQVAAMQLCSGADVAANNAAIATAVRAAAHAGAQLVCLPEAANLLLRDNRDYPGTCLPEAQDTTLALCAGLARELGIWLHTGSLLLRTEDGTRIWNRSHVIDPRGEVVARYDKLHTFDVRLGGAGDFQESASVRPGQGAPTVVEIVPLGLRLGLSICYDLRFGYLYEALAQAGADVLLIPASFSVVTGPLHWEVLLRARAIETCSYVVAPAQCGQRDGVRTYGHSRIVAPFGQVIAAAGDDPAVLGARLDPAEVIDARQRLPTLSQRRQLPPTHCIRIGD